MKTNKKIVSAILIFALLLTMLPVNVLAQELRKSIPELEIVKERPAKPDSKIIREVLEKREKNEKHFIKEDGTYEAVIYPSAVHYKENGEWKDIDNSLIDSKSEEGDDVLENKNNDYKVKIAKNTMSNKLVKLSKDDYELSWNIENPQNAASTVEPIKTDNLAVMSENDKKRILTKVSSTVNFKDIYPDVDLQYIIKPEQLKENIILNKKIDNPEFKYNLFTKNLTAKLLNDKTVGFYDANELEKEIFKIEAPFMFDANYSESGDIKIALEQTKQGYTLSIMPDKKWLDSPDRKYPVTIDPITSTSSDMDKIYDFTVREHDSIGVDSKHMHIRVGHGSYGAYRSFIRFTLPELTSGDTVIGANLLLQPDSGYIYGHKINIYRVTEDWDINKAAWTWSEKPGIDGKVEDYRVASASANNEWNITSLVKSWYVDQNNYGLALKIDNDTDITGTTTMLDHFYSSDNSGQYRPVISIRYLNNTGLENYWTYHSQSVGRAGTGYVNDNNGNLVFIHNDLSMSGKMPITINHVFNSDDKDISTGYGPGWMLNLTQRLRWENINGTAYFTHTDEDGTKHYFKYNSSKGYYEDEAGTGFTMTISGSGTSAIHIVKDKKDNKLVFDYNGYLKTIENSNGNKMTLTYNAGSKLIRVSDNAGRAAALNYNEDGYLLDITDPSGRRTDFRYTGIMLTKITYPDGKITTFTYDGNNNLTSAINHDGYKIGYTYYDSLTPGGKRAYRIKSVKEGHTSGTIGKELNISYGNNSTTFSDQEGRKNIYQFNDFGNTLSIKDADGNGKYYKYFDTEDKINKLGATSRLQKTVINLLENHSAEVTSSKWTSNYWQGSMGTISFTGEDKYIGSQSLKVEKTNATSRHGYVQSVKLDKDKTYTLSAYVKTKNISNTNGKGAALFVTYNDASGGWPNIDSKYVNGTNDWQRIEVKFTLPSNAPSTTVYVNTSIVGETGTAYFDGIQLEEGSIANRYNLLENSSLEGGTGVPAYWIKNGDTDASDTSAENGMFGQKSFKFTGQYGKYKYISQDIKISGNAGDKFVIGGWARGSSVPLTPNTHRYFALDVVLRGETKDQVEIISFNQGTSEWQYISDVIEAKEKYNGATVYLLYYDNANEAYFDGIQLYKEEFGTNFEYDVNGNLQRIKGSSDQESTFEYLNNDLKSVTDPKGNSLNYVYDSKHNIKKATSAENVVYSFDYDSYGNPKLSKVGDSTLFIESTATYTPYGNYLKEIKDASGNTATYNYNETKGTLTSVVDPKGNTTYYGYDNNDRLTSVSKAAGLQTVTNSYTYKNDRLETVTHNGFSYTFGYDSLGNNTTVDIGSQNLITNIYEARTSRLLDSNYGNGQKISYQYDILDRIIARVFNSSARYKYEYDGSGNLAYQEDLVNNVNYRYIYDLANRLVKVQDSSGNSTGFGYDKNNNSSKITDKIGNNTYATSYEYDKDDRPTKVTLNNGGTVSYAYDAIGRLNKKTVAMGSAQYVTDYEYVPGINGSTTNKLKKLSNNGSGFVYEYDGNGNIIKSTSPDGKVIEYQYNELNELVRENHPLRNITTIYTYDAGGNILSKADYPYTTGQVGTATKVYTYTYDDASWKDKLTKFSIQENTDIIDKSITYDAIGNVTLYDGYNYEWEEGRQLKTMSNGKQGIAFKYNDVGIRTEKVVETRENGVIIDKKTIKYHLVGDKVTFETNGTDNIYYSYDSTGDLVSMNLNGVEYYYIRNGQGNITGLLDGNGTQVVWYSYDTWGKLLSVTGSLASTVGEKNPYRYRGYRYDTETGLYYLQSRYYNPEWGRFINADAVLGQTGELLGHNLFAYVQNNPVRYADPSGYSLVDIVSELNLKIGIFIWSHTFFWVEYAQLRVNNAISSFLQKTFDTAWKKFKGAENYSKEFTNWLNAGKANNKVYQGVINGEPVYTGITKQELSTRLYQHNYGGKGLDYLQETFSGLTRNQARAIEQYFIENGPGNALNQINSISPTSAYYNDAMRWATDFINGLK